MGDFDVFCIEDGYCSPANIVQSIEYISGYVPREDTNAGSSTVHCQK